MNLVGCEQEINSLIMHIEAQSLNLSKALINPTLLNLQNITHLYLNNCNLHNAQLDHLFDLLLVFAKIELLCLSSPQVSNKNHLTRYEKLYYLIQNCKSLKDLRLSSCSITK